MSKACIQLRNGHKSFGETKVLRGVNFDLNPGERASICGPSGAGKSTLLRILAGLDPMDQGDLEIWGKPAHKIPPWERDLQFVFQDLGLWPSRTVLQHLADVLQNQGYSGKESKQMAGDSLKRLSIFDLASNKPHQLSGGEARRLAFARALIQKPKILLLDEPFASLDSDAKSLSQSWLAEILQQSEAAVVLVTHDETETHTLGGKILHLRQGVLHSA
jgi:iron(III) transport system ATP-binding protein